MPAPVAGGGFKDADNVGIFLLQACAVNIERVPGQFCCRQTRTGRLAAKGLDDLEPVFDAIFFLGKTGIEHQQVQAALSEEELVGWRA